MLDRGDPTVLRLANWARWARDRHGRREHAGSAEGRYRPEQLRGDEEEDRRAPGPSVDVLDALEVFARINPTGGFPTRSYLALSAAFVFRCRGESFRAFLRRRGIGVRGREIESIVAEAVDDARRVLKRGGH